MEFLNLFNLFVNYIFGDVIWAILGVGILILLMSYISQWGFETQVVFLSGYFLNMIALYNPIFGAVFFIGGFVTFGYGIYSFMRRDGG